MLDLDSRTEPAAPDQGPTQIDAAQARRRAEAWLAELAPAPKNFLRKARIDGELERRSFAFWRVSCHVVADWRGDMALPLGGRTAWKEADGRLSGRHAAYVAADGKDAATRLVESLVAPPSADDSADAADVPADIVKRGRERIEDAARAAIRREIGGVDQRVTAFEATLTAFAAAPKQVDAFVGAYRYRGRLYPVAVAPDGSVAGAPPPLKSGLGRLLAFIAAAAIAAGAAIGWLLAN